MLNDADIDGLFGAVISSLAFRQTLPWLYLGGQQSKISKPLGRIQQVYQIGSTRLSGFSLFNATAQSV